MDYEALNTLLHLEDTLVTFSRQGVVTISLSLALLGFFFVAGGAPRFEAAEPWVPIAVVGLGLTLVLAALTLLATGLRNFNARLELLPTAVREREKHRSRAVVLSLGATFVVLLLFVLLLCHLSFSRARQAQG